VQCPCDDSTLRPLAAGQCVVFKCDRCRGIWLSRETLRSLSEHLARPEVLTPPLNRHTFSRSTRLCPVCSPEPLTKLPTHGIEVDVCSNCHGVWLDAGELRNVARRGPRAAHSGWLDNPLVRALDGAGGGDAVATVLVEAIPAGVEASAAGLEAIGELLVDVISAIAP
jgi:Zn-finger nucleic acid-binding protein